jgi:hypothetical protein
MVPSAHHPNDGAGAMAQGITVFRSVADAMRHGYEIWDRTEYGYLARTRTARGYAFAIVVVRNAR